MPDHLCYHQGTIADDDIAVQGAQVLSSAVFNLIGHWQLHLNSGGTMRILFCTLFFVSLVSQSRAESVYDNFGTGDSYNQINANAIGSTRQWEPGVGFIFDGGPSRLESVEAAMYYSRGVNEVVLTLFDSVDGLPGSVLERSSLLNLPNVLATPTDRVVTFDFLGTAVLESGHEYLLVASNINDGSTSHGWYFNDSGDQTPRVYRSESRSWSRSGTAGAFRVNVTPVPEPSPLMVLMFLTIAATASRRR